MTDNASVQTIPTVVNITDTSIPGVQPGMHVEFSTGHILSIIKPMYMYGSEIIEIACWMKSDPTNWISNPHWGDCVYRVLDIDEFNSECAMLIPGFTPISLPAKFAITK